MVSEAKLWSNRNFAASNVDFFYYEGTLGAVVGKIKTGTLLGITAHILTKLLFKL